MPYYIEANPGPTSSNHKPRKKIFPRLFLPFRKFPRGGAPGFFSAAGTCSPTLDLLSLIYAEEGYAPSEIFRPDPAGKPLRLEILPPLPPSSRAERYSDVSELGGSLAR